MSPPFDDLQHRDHRVRRAAIPRAADHDDRWALLSPLLLDPYPPARHDAALALGERAATDPDLLGRLTALAEGGGDLRRCQAALIALARAGRLAQDPQGAPWERACAAALRWLDHDDADLRFQAASALEHLGAQSDDALAALLRRLDDGDDEVFAQSAALLARLGERTALPALAARWGRLRGDARRVALMATARLLALPGADTAPPRRRDRRPPARGPQPRGRPRRLRLARPPGRPARPPRRSSP
jgi:HEAT repeat protein